MPYIAVVQRLKEKVKANVSRPRLSTQTAEGGVQKRQIRSQITYHRIINPIMGKMAGTEGAVYLTPAASKSIPNLVIR